VVISLLLAEVCSAQSNSTLSTLQKKLTTAQTLKEKAIIYSDISWEYRFESKKKSLEFAELGLLTYQKINDKEGIAMSYQDYGNTYYANGEYNEALRYYFISLNLLEKSNLKMLSGKTLSKISILYKFIR
jgi:tetratricopeptide (TPR) repeat protein